MFRKVAVGVTNASKWADDAKGQDVASAIDELFFSLIKLFFALTHFVGSIVEKSLSYVLIMVPNPVETYEKRQARKLKASLNWKKKDEPEPANTGYLRR